MALKLGAENKRNVIIAGVLFAVVAYLGISQLVGSSTPAPAPAPSRPATARATQGSVQSSGQSSGAAPFGSSAGPAARKLPSTGLDPALHLERLASSESIEYAGNGRNIFSFDSAPVRIETPAASARPQEQVAVDPGPPPKPQPPQIDLRYFGYASSNGGERKAFLLHGEDIFEASAGEIVDHRFKIVAVLASSVQVTDLSYNNTQTLPLIAN
jgi:hypothetical protein